MLMRRRRARRARGRSRSISMPSNATPPEVGSINRSIMRATVDLPEPDSPTSPSVCPRASVSETPSTTRRSPYCFTRSRATSKGAARSGAPAISAPVCDAIAGYYRRTDRSAMSASRKNRRHSIGWLRSKLIAERSLHALSLIVGSPWSSWSRGSSKSSLPRTRRRQSSPPPHRWAGTAGTTLPVA